MIFISSSAGLAQSSLDGNWVGGTNVIERRMLVQAQFKNEGGAMSGTIDEVNHESFDENWQYELDNQCRETLKPLLKQVASTACRELADLKLHGGAEISVNGRNSWSQYILAFKY